MMRNILLDTHVWLWLANGDSVIPQSARRLIDQTAETNSLFISAISVWEISMLETKKRIRLGQPILTWVHNALSQSKINLTPLSPEIAVESCQLPNNFHGDPADRILVATARIENFALMTKDEKLVQYGAEKFVTILDLAQL